MSRPGAGILVVDDDEGMVEALADVLRDQGYSVAVARNGVEALAYLGSHSLPRLILLDLMMPVMDGYAFRAQQRKRADWAAIPTVVMTAGAVDPSIRDLGLTGWLRKPAALDTLLAVIEKHAREPAVGEHVVQFYKDPVSLCRGVAAFVATGLDAGDAVVMITTAAHRAAFVGRLESDGVDVSALERSGRITLLDASDTLETIVNDGAIDRRVFEHTMGELVQRVSRPSGVKRIRAYGEMVNLLWQRGDLGMALSLERLWNGMQRRYPFSLYCSYLIENDLAAAAPLLPAIVREHSTVVPLARAAG